MATSILMLTAVCLLFVAEAKAATVTYSWSGTLGEDVSKTGGTDPWDADGKSYTLSATFDVDAADQRASGLYAVPFANFAPESISFLIDGTPADSVSLVSGVSFHEFFPSHDAIELSLDVAFRSHTSRIINWLELPNTTWSFSSAAETLPILTNPLTVVNSPALAADGLFYKSHVAPGTLVHVSSVPEPTSMTILLSAVCGICFRRRRRRSCQRREAED